MPIVGHGIDLVEIARIKKMIDSHGQHFLDRCFTPAEQDYSHKQPKRTIEHLAGRFAAKEAVLKVLGTGWSQGIAWTDVEVVNEVDGKPTVRLAGKCAAVAQSVGIEVWHVSITHTETHAMASAIGETSQAS